MAVWEGKLMDLAGTKKTISSLYMETGKPGKVLDLNHFSFARTITWDSGNNIGDMGGHTKVVLSGDFKKTRPFKVVTASEDKSVNFYEGPPFKFKKSNKIHTNFVTQVKYSPDYTKFVSVGFDKKVILYDGKSGDVLETIGDETTENNHKSAIISVVWLDDNTLVTGALDKLVKVWKIQEKEIITLLSCENPDKVENILAGVANNNKYVLSLTLDGKLNFWDRSTLEDKKLPDLVVDGHQNYISAVAYNSKLKIIYSADTNGKIRKIYY